MGAKILKIGQHLDMPASNQSLTTLMSLISEHAGTIIFSLFSSLLALIRSCSLINFTSLVLPACLLNPAQMPQFYIIKTLFFCFLLFFAE
jgi:hypothetical protein